MNVSIRPFPVLVRKEYLYDNDPSRVGEYAAGRVIGASAYAGCPLTFHVLLDNAYLYSDLPLTSFVHQVNDEPYSLKTLSHIACPCHELDHFTLACFLDKEVAVYFKGTGKWTTGCYLTSFDFYAANELLHLLRLDDGNFCLAPNHKINWDGTRQLADYRKSHITHEMR